MPEADVSLLRRFAEAHDQEAFAELVRRHMNAVYSAALRRVGGEAHLAKDVAQQVFVTLAQHAEKLARHPVLTAWLYATTRNAAVNAIRGESRRRKREQEAHAMQEAMSDGGSRLDWERAAPVLDAAIDSLSETDRRAVLLRFFDQRTFPQIAVALRMTDDAARRRVDRALEKLRRRLQRRGLASSAAALGAALAQHTVAAAPAGLVAEVTDAALAEPPAAGGGWLHAGLERTAAVTGVAALLVSLGVAWQRHDEAETARRALVAETRELAALERHVQTLARLAPKRETRTAEAAPDREIAAAELRPRAGGRRLEIAATYDPFYRAAGLTPEQIARFEEILAQSPGLALWTFDAQPLRPAGVTPGAPLLPEAAIESALRGLLGEAGFRQYRDYQRLLPARAVAVRLASAVYLSDPLEAARGEQLTRIVAEASGPYRAGGAVDRAAVDWERMLHEAAAVLSPAQWAELGGAVRQEELYLGRLAQRLQAEQAGASERRVAP